jgi:hypothetical protein
MKQVAKIGYLEQFFNSRKGYEGDNRKKGVFAVFSYFTKEGIEFRKGYWFPIGTPENGIFAKVPNEIKVEI